MENEEYTPPHWAERVVVEGSTKLWTKDNIKIVKLLNVITNQVEHSYEA